MFTMRFDFMMFSVTGMHEAVFKTTMSAKPIHGGNGGKRHHRNDADG